MAPIYYAFDTVGHRAYTIGHEKLANMRDEIVHLHRAHFNETETLYKDAPFDMDYERFMASESAGQFVTFTLRDKNEEMVGYLQYYVYRDTHSQNVYIGREDAFFIRKDHRIAGLASAMIKFAEAALKQLGCSYVGMSSKAPAGGPDLGNFLKRKGYKAVATYYSKILEN